MEPSQLASELFIILFINSNIITGATYIEIQTQFRWLQPWTAFGVVDRLIEYILKVIDGCPTE